MKFANSWPFKMQMVKKSSLFIGRFQPLHIGHLADIKSIIAKDEHCMVAIAAMNKIGTWRNPLTGDERERILRETLETESELDPKGLRQNSYSIHQMSDIDNDEKCVEHVVGSLPPFEKVYSGSKYVREFFIKDGRFEAVPVKMIHGEDGERLCSTNIRKKVLKWEDYGKEIHPRTAEILNELAFRERLVKITPKPVDVAHIME